MIATPQVEKDDRRSMVILRHRKRWIRLLLIITISYPVLSTLLLVRILTGPSESFTKLATSFAVYLPLLVLPSIFVLFRPWKVQAGWKIGVIFFGYILGGFLAVLAENVRFAWWLTQPFEMFTIYNLMSHILIQVLCFAPLLALSWYTPRLPIFTSRTHRLT